MILSPFVLDMNLFFRGTPPPPRLSCLPLFEVLLLQHSEVHRNHSARIEQHLQEVGKLCSYMSFEIPLLFLGSGGSEVPTGLNTLAFDDDVKSGRIKIVIHRYPKGAVTSLMQFLDALASQAFSQSVSQSVSE